MRALLINNRPIHSGIGEHTINIFNELQNLDTYDSIKLLELDSSSLDRIFQYFWGKPILEQLESAIRILYHIFFILKIPKDYELYHITNAGLALACDMVKPTVVTVHDMIPFSQPRSVADFFLKRSLSRVIKADRIITVSEYTKRELLKFLKIDPSLIAVIPNGVNHDIYKPVDKEEAIRYLEWDKDAFTILHVGNEEPRKNIPTLFKVFKNILEVNPKAKLIRVGMKNPHLDTLKEKFNIRRNLKYYQDVSDLNVLYNSADVFLFPSLLEGFGIPPLEAMASGCPTVTSNTSALPEVVGKGGIMFDPYDVDGMTEEVLKIMSDKKYAKKLSRHGIKQSEKFSWHKTAKKTHSVYQEVLT